MDPMKDEHLSPQDRAQGPQDQDGAAHGDTPYGAVPDSAAPYGGAPYGGAPYVGAPYGGAPCGGAPCGGAPYGEDPYRAAQEAVTQQLPATTGSSPVRPPAAPEEAASAAQPFGTFAAPGPAASPRSRRGPGWGGVTGLVALGMLVSSGLTLGGVVTYDQLFDDGPAAASPADPGSGTEARPAAASTADAPDWATVAKQVSPSAVAIQVATSGGTSQGTGVVLDDRGAILTNNHVVEDGNAVQVTTSEGLSYAASIVGTDPVTDLAVIRLDSPPEGLQPATFADSSTVVVGQPVMALGTPLGLENTITTGIVSAVDRPVTASGEATDGSDTTYTSALQTDAAINPGNSGGPLVDAAGQVIGINTAIAGIPSSSGQAGSIGLGFAIPSNTAAMIADQLQQGGTAQHAFLGLTSSDGTAQAGEATHRGAEVVAVEPDSPAAQAGVQDGDLITGIDDIPIGGAGALTGVVRGMEIGSTHQLEVVRGGSVESIEVTLGERPI